MAEETLSGDALAVKAALDVHMKLERERDSLKQQLELAMEEHAKNVRDYESRLVAANTRIESLEGERGQMESRVASAVAARDAARDREAVMFGFFASMKAQFEAFVPPEFREVPAERLNRTPAFAVPLGDGEDAGDQERRSA